MPRICLAIFPVRDKAASIATRKVNRQCEGTLKCKVLLPKFNTWEEVHPERENGFFVPFGSDVGPVFLRFWPKVVGFTA